MPDITNRDNLHRYWTRGKGLAKWYGHAHPWTALYHHLLKYLPAEEAKRTAANWFHEVYGMWPGDKRHTQVTSQETAHARTQGRLAVA